MRLCQPQWDPFVWQSIPGGAEWEGFLMLETQTLRVDSVEYATIVILSDNFELLQPRQCVQFFE